MEYVGNGSMPTFAFTYCSMKGAAMWTLQYILEYAGNAHRPHIEVYIIACSTW